jgi:lactose/L-arabinose transport system permease protein
MSSSLVQVPLMVALATVHGRAAQLVALLKASVGSLRFAFFAPVVVGEVAYAAVFRLMFTADFGASSTRCSTASAFPAGRLVSPTRLPRWR